VANFLSTLLQKFRERNTPRPPRPLPKPRRGRHLEYCPNLDGDADPGEIVWTWVPFEDDPSQGKDRPVVVIGRRDEDAGEDARERADDPDAGEHHEHGNDPAEPGDRVPVAVSHGRDRDDRPPQRVATGGDVRIGGAALELQDEHARGGQHDERARIVMNAAYCPRCSTTSWISSRLR